VFPVDQQIWMMIDEISDLEKPALTVFRQHTSEKAAAVAWIQSTFRH